MLGGVNPQPQAKIKNSNGPKPKVAKSLELKAEQNIQEDILPMVRNAAPEPQYTDQMTEPQPEAIQA